MLAGTSASVTDALAEIGPASVEWKLDGIRVQAHKLGDEVRRSVAASNDITAGLPGVVEVLRQLPTDSVRARRRSPGRLPTTANRAFFQETMERDYRPPRPTSSTSSTSMTPR